MDLEIHVPISPTPGFFNRVRYLLRSWQIFGDPNLSYRLVITVGVEQDPEDLSAWVPWASGQNIAWRWFNGVPFRRHWWWGTINSRFQADIEADYFLMVDADTLFTGPIGEAIALLPSDNGIAGVMAYASPFRDLLPGETSAQRWQQLFAALGFGQPRLAFAHSASGEACPAYYNNAFLLMRRETAKKIGQIIFHEMENCDRAIGNMMFRDQIAVTQAIERLGLSPVSLPLRYNHPIGDAGPASCDEWSKARLFHYTVNDTFNAERDGDSPQSIAAWLERTRDRGLSGARGRFRERIETVHRRLRTDGRAD
jgi:hypothetical protein